MLSRVQFFCNPIDCSPPGSSVHGISQARILEWVAISFSRESFWPRDQTWVSCIGRQVLYCWVSREPCSYHEYILIGKTGTKYGKYKSSQKDMQTGHFRWERVLWRKSEWWARGQEREEEATWSWAIQSLKTHLDKKKIGSCLSGEQVIQEKGRSLYKSSTSVIKNLKHYEGDILIM